MILCLIRLTAVTWALWIRSVTTGQGLDLKYSGMSRPELIVYLRRSYVKAVSPDTRPTIVKLGLSMIHVHGLDVTRGELRATIGIMLKWRDERFRWDPGETRDGVTRMSLDIRDVWQPDITITNSILPMKPIHTPVAVISRTSDVSFSQSYYIETTCLTDDTAHDQSCELIFRSWRRGIDEVDLMEDSSVNVDDTSDSNSEWLVTNRTFDRRIDNTSDVTPFAQLVVTLVLERQHHDVITLRQEAHHTIWHSTPARVNVYNEATSVWRGKIVGVATTLVFCSVIDFVHHVLSFSMANGLYMV